MDWLRGVGDRFAVVDLETTGVYNKDRVVEVAAVTVSPNGQIVDEWDTLVNPERDVGPTYLHRVTASMVSAAPTFSEVSAALAERLNGAILVAHNLPFDSRMLANEYERSGGHLDPGQGVCTLQLTRDKLANACAQRSIPLEYPHRALADARATARLLRRTESDIDGASLAPVAVEIPLPAFRPRTLRRDYNAENGEEMPYLARCADRAHHYGEHGAALVYMDLLDWAISDLVITKAERSQLTELAVDVGLSLGDVAEVHRRYLDELTTASLRDGFVDENETDLLQRVAEALGIDRAVVLDRIEDWFVDSSSIVLGPGTRVCFTGSATYPDGTRLDRSELETMATKLGLHPVDNVTKKGCDLLVAADPSSQSGKARKARKYGLPIASVEDFLSAQEDGVLAAT